MKTFNQNLQNAFNSIRDKVLNGEKVLVEFNDIIWEDGYLDKGMRAYIVGVGETDVYDMEDGKIDKVTEFKFDFSEFSKFNVSKEQKIEWTDGQMQTCTERGEVPFDSKETSFFSEAYDELPFTILHTKVNSLMARYQKSNSSLSYTQWLELQVMKRN